MKKYQIFISSTYEDLKEERGALERAVLSMRHIPMGMEQFSASDAEQWEIIKETIQTSDYLVLVLGFRYGSRKTDGGVSFTEAEYDYAVSQGVPVLAFLRDEHTPLLHQYYDEDQAPVRAFREKVKETRLCQFWSSEADLVPKVTSALYAEFQRSPRSGWSRSKEDARNQWMQAAKAHKDASPPETREAMNCCKKALELDPTSVDAQRELAGTYFDLREYENAALHFRRTAEICKADWNYFCVGLSYEYLGDYRMAWDFYLKTWILNPGYAGLKERMEQCRQKLSEQGAPPPETLRLP